MREIESNLYRITIGTLGSYKIVECESEIDLIDYVFRLERDCLVTNISKLEFIGNNVRTPKFAYRTHPYYKQRMQENRRKWMENNKKNKN